jgi:hypothetical protein
LGFGEIVRHLQVDPEQRIGVEVLAEADRRICGDAAALAHDLGQPVGRHADRFRKGPCAHAERVQVFLAQHLPRMGSDTHSTALVDDLDIRSVVSMVGWGSLVQPDRSIWALQTR